MRRSSAAVAAAALGVIAVAAARVEGRTAPGDRGGGARTGAAASAEPREAPPIQRLAGASRIATAVTISQATFADAQSAGAVVLARADLFPDALAGGPLAVSRNAPLLLTASDQLDPATLGEIQRVASSGSTVFVLGGTGALSPRVESDLTSAGFAVTRVAGSNRYETAVAVADQLDNPGAVILATGTDFPDALAAGPAAAVTGGVVLLSAGTTMPPATAQYLAAHPGPVTAIGGAACAASPSATCVAGSDRYATSAAVASTFFTTPALVGVASGSSFPDGLAGGPALGDQPLLLVPSSGQLPDSIGGYLRDHNASIAGGLVFGGPAAVSDPMLQQVSDALAG